MYLQFLGKKTKINPVYCQYYLDWQTRLTTADGSSIELDPSLLEPGGESMRRSRYTIYLLLHSEEIEIFVILVQGGPKKSL